jgi:hypothetical protein
MLKASLEHLAANRRAAALDTISRAFDQHLDELFRLREEMVPYGITMNARQRFAWAGRRRLFPGLTWVLLRHAGPYLLSSLSVDQIDTVAFTSAVRLLLRLRLLFLLQKPRS